MKRKRWPVIMISALLLVADCFMLTDCARHISASGETSQNAGLLKDKKENNASNPPEENASSNSNASSVASEIPSSKTTDPEDDWKLLLVNDRNTISESFEPELEVVQGVYKMDSRVAPIMRQLIADAKSQGIDLMVCSAYRPYSSQLRNFEASVSSYMQAGYSRENAEQATLRLIAAPGSSEHQTGLAADIVTPSYQGLDDGYADTDAAKWLKANAASYGFILRYPKGKEDSTHIDFEPWHYRYVGEEAAKEIMDKEICLEEYLEQ